MNTITRTAIALLLGMVTAGCATTSRTLPTEPTLTVYCHEGDLQRCDVADTGPSLGDLTAWWADVHGELPASRDPKDSPKIGIASGFNITTSADHELGDGQFHEFRVSNFNLRWFDSEDQLVWSGLHDYASEGGRLINEARRPVIGGAGRFLDRPGVAVVTPEGGNWFRVDLYLLD
ncbi:MAG: hypothetical protein CMJ52_08250 [Planctomycetaceae bacterium]|nr:hypothetical protein [Planctomycetaceae bacterium]